MSGASGAGMRIVVAGGSSPVGRMVCELLRRSRHDVVVASRSAGVDPVTGERLADAMAGAEAVVDASFVPPLEDDAAAACVRASTFNLLAAGAAAGVRHHVALSLVGRDRHGDDARPSGCRPHEVLIARSQVPYTVVRATQLFECLMPIAQAGTRGRTVRVSSAAFQPVAAADVALALVGAVLGSPLGGVREVAGPQVFRLDEVIRALLRASRDPREVVTDDEAPFCGRRLSTDSLLPGAGAHIGETSLESWLSAGNRAR